MLSFKRALFLCISALNGEAARKKPVSWSRPNRVDLQRPDYIIHSDFMSSRSLSTADPTNSLCWFTLFFVSYLRVYTFSTFAFWPLKVCCLPLPAFFLFSGVVSIFALVMKRACFGVVYLRCFMCSLVAMWMINKTQIRFCSSSFSTFCLRFVFMPSTQKLLCATRKREKNKENNFGNGNFGAMHDITE